MINHHGINKGNYEIKHGTDLKLRSHHVNYQQVMSYSELFHVNALALIVMLYKDIILRPSRSSHVVTA